MSARTLIEAQPPRTYWLGYIDSHGAVQLRRARRDQNHDGVFTYASNRKFRYVDRAEPWPFGFDVFAADWSPDVQEKDAIHRALLRAGVTFGGTALGEAEVKPPRRWLVTIPTESDRPWRKVVVTATSEAAAWYQAYGTPARNYRLSRSQYSDPRVVVLKRGSNGIVGYIDPILPE